MTADNQRCEAAQADATKHTGNQYTRMRHSQVFLASNECCWVCVAQQLVLQSVQVPGVQHHYLP